MIKRRPPPTPPSKMVHERSLGLLVARSLALCALTLSGVFGPSISLAQQPEQPPPPERPAVSPDYTIGPGDSLNVFVWRNPDLSTTVAVRPDGKISIPLVDDMPAVGKNPS